MASAPRQRALLCDAMGTIVHLLPPAPRLKRALGQRLGVTVTTAQARHALAAEIAYYRTHMLEGRDARTVADLHRGCASALAAALPALAGTDLETLTELLLGCLRFGAFPDAAAALRAARARGTRVIVVSNWDASLPAALGSAGLIGLVDAVVTSAEVGAAKPDPMIFARALSLAGVDPVDALHVGDSLAEDVAGARMAGIAAVWVNRGGAPVPPGVCAVASLAELRPAAGRRSP